MKKITFLDKGMYSIDTNEWAFVKQIKGGYVTLGDTQTCKDYTHEAICNSIHKNKIKSFCGYNGNAGVVVDKLQFVMFFSSDDDTKKRVISTKRMLNYIERKNGLPTTTITEVKIVSKNHIEKNKLKSAFVFTADKTYIESPALMHGMFAFLRTMHLYGKNITYKNTLKILKSKNIKDAAVLKYVLTNDIMGILIRNHPAIIKGLNLKRIYPKKVTNIVKGKGVASYHGGFGMGALSIQRFAVKVYAKRVLKVLDDNKIQKIKW